MLSLNVTLSPDTLFQEIDGEAVILDLASSSYFGLDGVGVRVWQLLEANPSLEATVEQLIQEYEVDIQQLSEDLVKLINQLEEAGLVTTS